MNRGKAQRDQGGDLIGTDQSPAPASHQANLVEDELSTLFAALADPTRRAILSRLAEGDATVNELAEPFAITFQAVSKHLKVLERAGLVSRGRQAQFRPVRLEPDGFDPAARWLEDHRAMRLAQLDRLEQAIHSLRSTPAASSRTGDPSAGDPPAAGPPPAQQEPAGHPTGDPPGAGHATGTTPNRSPT